MALKLDFPLLSDLDGRVCKEWGVLVEEQGFMEGRAYRTAFLIDTNMIVRYKWVPDDPSYEPDYDRCSPSSKVMMIRRSPMSIS